MLLVACKEAEPETLDPVQLATQAETPEVALVNDFIEPVGASNNLVEPSIETPLEATVEIFPIESAEGTSEAATALSVSIANGESLALLSGWSGVSIEEIAVHNEMSVSENIYPGQVILIPMDPEDEVAFADAREMFAADRMDRYLLGRGGVVNTELHTVRTGETAWSISKEMLSAPIWVLSWYNSDLDLDNLQIGQEIVLPVLGDSVAFDDE